MALESLKLKPGSIFGGILLIAGSCIGAGMIGLPILLGLMGFVPAMIVLFISWIFMTYTGLLLIEVNGWFHERVNIISMAQKSFGNFGKALSWILYLLLFYSLLVAYIAGSGKLFLSFASFSMPEKVFEIIFVLVFAFIVYFGTKTVDFTNRILMFGLIISYLYMIILGLTKIDFSLYAYVNVKFLLMPLAVLITSFGFHNMIPSITAYMKGDLKRTKIAIFGGSLFALIIYFFWIVLVIGIVPVDELMQAYLKGEPAVSLKNVLSSNLVNLLIGYFTFFAVITSFLTQSLGLMHFIADGLKVKPDRKNNVWLVILATFIPLIFALIYPNVFYAALSFAGAYCAIILFGIFPALMVWIGRYLKKESSAYHVKGGKISLILVILFSVVIILNQLYRLFN
jgi:tyrosine-specific transport protein